MSKNAWLNKSVRVELNIDDVQIFKEGLILAYDDRREAYLVRTDWGDEWFTGEELRLPPDLARGAGRA